MIPSTVKTGGSGLSRIPPPIEIVPLRTGAVVSASAVRTADAVLWTGDQEPLQRPSFEDVRRNGESALENDTTTDPLVMAFPQSSATRTTIACGQAAGTPKPPVKVVNNGTNNFGVQPVIAAVGPSAVDPLPAGARIRRMATERSDPSEKASDSAP